MMLSRIFLAAMSLHASTALPQVNPEMVALPAADLSNPAVTETGINPADHPEVVRVDCDSGRGTAFKVGPHILLSVAHVTNIGGCTINGKPIKVLQTSGDFAEIYSDDTADSWLTIDCDGFKAGQRYIAIGFARGMPFQTTVDVWDTGKNWAGFERLWGIFTVIPGQSGGAMIDSDTGKVVGTINVYDAQRGDSGSIALKDTPICKANVS